MASESPEPSAPAATEEHEQEISKEEEPAKIVSRSPSTEDRSTSDAKDAAAQAEATTETTQNPEGAEPGSVATTSALPTNGDWQAIFSPQHNAYYFFNTATQQTTWENPVQPATQPEASTSTATANQPSKFDAALAAGIDPSLAYLDPTLGAGPGGVGGSYAAAARFNARTGRFTAEDARDPSHMSEYERAKRMSQFYFDVDGWQKQRDQEQAEEEADGKKRKRPSKKDLERFKEQKKQKKIAKTAWLRT